MTSLGGSCNGSKISYYSFCLTEYDDSPSKLLETQIMLGALIKFIIVAAWQVSKNTAISPYLIKKI